MKKRVELTENPLREDVIEKATAPAPKRSAKKVAPKETKPPIRLGTQVKDFKTTIQRTRFSFAENHANKQFTSLLREALGSKVHESDISRAFWDILRRHQHLFKKVVNEQDKVARPAYGDRAALEKYEAIIADLIMRVLRAADK